MNPQGMMHVSKPPCGFFFFLLDILMFSDLAFLINEDSTRRVEAKKG
jgi:hypothetical protein